MNIQQDFKELLELLEENKVDYMIVGGYAVAFHGYPRFTKDLDIFYANSGENCKRIVKAVCKFGFAESNVPIDTLLKEGNIITFGVMPSRVDLINKIDGVSFLDAKINRLRGRYGDIETCGIERSTGDAPK